MICQSWITGKDSKLTFFLKGAKLRFTDILTKHGNSIEINLKDRWQIFSQCTRGLNFISCLLSVRTGILTKKMETFLSSNSSYLNLLLYQFSFYLLINLNKFAHHGTCRMWNIVNKDKRKNLRLEATIFLLFPFCKCARFFIEVLILMPLNCYPSEELKSLGMLNKLRIMFWHSLSERIISCIICCDFPLWCVALHTLTALEQYCTLNLKLLYFWEN